MMRPCPSVAALRPGLDILPVAGVGEAGLLLRYPFRYTKRFSSSPHFLAHGLLFLDGERTEIDLQAELSRLVGRSSRARWSGHSSETLKDGGFSGDRGFDRLRTCATMNLPRPSSGTRPMPCPPPGQ